MQIITFLSWKHIHQLFHPIIHSIQSEINNHIYHLILNNHTIILFFTLPNPIIKDHHIMHSTHINLLQLDGICLHIRLTNPCLSSSLQLINNISTQVYIACMKLTQSMRPKKPVPSYKSHIQLIIHLLETIDQ